MHRTFKLPAIAIAIVCLLSLPAIGTISYGQVPGYSVEMTPADYQTLFTRNVFNDTYLPAPFTSNDTLWPEARVRFKGHSTRYYAKKSYRVRFADTNLFHGYRQINFNSMYTDKSFMREKLAWDLFRDLGALAPTADHAEFSINGDSKGLYLLIPKVDRYLLQLNGRQVAPMYEADDFYALADLTVQPDSLLKLYYAKEIGDAADYSDLAALISALNSAPAGSFADTVRQHFDTTSILQWFAVNALTMMGDSYNKNYLLYRDTSRAAQQWTVIPWDYDLSWGRTGDLAVPYPASLLNDGFAYSFSPLAGPDNVLKDRFMATTELRDGFKSYLSGVLSTVFTEAHLWPRIDSLAALMRSDAAADPERWGTMEDFEEHIEALKYYVTARRNYLLKTFINPPSGAFDIATMPFTGEGVPHHYVGVDGRLLATLSFTGVTGLDSVTVITHPNTMPPDVPPPFDARWVNRWIEVIPHPPTAQFTTKFRWAYQDVSSTDREVGIGVGDERILRAYHHDGSVWSTLPGEVNAFANTVTIDTLTAGRTGPGKYFALMLSDTYNPTWQRMANNYWERWHDIRFPDSVNGFIVGEHGSFLRTSDGGDSWERDSIGSALHFFSGDMSAPWGRLFAAGESGSFYASDDTGRTWASAVLGVTDNMRAVSFDGDAGVVVGDSGRAFATFDGGSSWSEVVTGLTGDFQSVRFSNSSVDYFIAVGPGVRVFTEIFVPLPPPEFTLSKSFPAAHPLRSVTLVGSTFWVAGDSGYVAFADTADTMLMERNLPVRVSLRDIEALDSLRIFVTGDGGAIFYTADAGLTWYRQLTGDTHDLYAIAFTGTGRGFAVGNGGTILRTGVPGTLTGVGADAPFVPSAFRLLQNYPNPFNPATTIAFDLPSDATVSIEIFDVLGRLVAPRLSGPAPGESLPPGRHTAEWNAGRRATGVYFYRMNAVDRSGRLLFNDVKKMVLVR
ncbi:MAG TPA: CotH kinase family protein [Bacteroidota bacterium]|nr:CotH kinase family protein [Bacteroidota bacterium]